MLCFMAGNTPKTKALGVELRRHRNTVDIEMRSTGDEGMPLRKLAGRLGVSHVTIQRWETGERAPAPEEVSAYLAVLEVPVKRREELIEMARDMDNGIWLSVRPRREDQLGALLELESTAKTIATVSPLLVPGLLQTADYTRAIMSDGAVPAGEIATRVAVRIGRREAITRRRAPVHLNAFIGEAVLYQNLGGPTVMAEQLETLLELGKLPNVEIRAIPMSAPWHAGLEGPFSVLTSADGEQPVVVHIENRLAGLFHHDPAEVRAYETALPRVAEVAMSPADTAGLIARVMSPTMEERTR